MNASIFTFSGFFALSLCLAQAESPSTSQPEKLPPALSISKAASLAENELLNLKASKNHFIKSIILIGNRYTAMIEPALPEDPSNPDGKKISISIAMDGTVTHYGTTIERRIIKPSRLAIPAF